MRTILTEAMGKAAAIEVLQALTPVYCARVVPTGAWRRQSEAPNAEVAGMQRWGFLVTAFYLIVVFGLVVPFGAYLSTFEAVNFLPELFNVESLLDGGWVVWIAIAVLAAAQALLLFVSVDTTRRRLRPRQRVCISVATTAFATGLLSIAIVLPLAAAVDVDGPFNTDLGFWITLAGFWGAWAVIFYLYRERLSERFDRAVSWLLNGSVLQLLIAVPCHIVVRQRGECSAPIVTGFGISTGIAIMLMAFGPSVVFLYQKRLREYGGSAQAEPIVHRWPIGKTLGTLAIGAAALFVFLPFDDDWFLGLELPMEQSQTLSTAVVEITERFGMTIQPGADDDFELQCHGDSVVRVTVSPASDNSGETWQFRLRADQGELLAMLQTLAEAHATNSWATVGPPALEQWRARTMKGAYLGRGCHPR